LIFIDSFGCRTSKLLYKKELRVFDQPACGSLNHSGISIAFHFGMKTLFSSSSNLKEMNAMLANNLFDEDFSVSYINLNTAKRRYAWLEKEGNMWHFLTNLFADPEKSTRRWANKQRALEELTKEGWTVLYPYPEQSSPERSVRSSACGYGLMWIDQ
jgi:hypothetical protein